MSRWKNILIPVFLGLIGAALNLVQVPFFYESFLVLGPCIALYLAINKSILEAAFVSVLSSIPLVFYWNDFWPLIVFTIEVLFIGVFYSRISKNLIIGVIVFWLAISTPLQAYFFSNESLLDSYSFIFVLQRLINALIYAQITIMLNSIPAFSRVMLLKLEPGHSKSIRKKYAHNLSLLLVTSSFTVALLLIQQQTSNLYKEQETQMELFHQMITGELSKIVNTIADEIQLTANSYSWIWENQEKWSDFLSDSHAKISNLYTMILVDKEANVVAFSVPDHMTVDPENIISVADRDYFIHTINSKETYVSDGFKGRGLGNDLIVAISAGVPSQNEQENLGVVQGSIILNQLSDFSELLNPNSSFHALITDKNNNVLFASNSLDLSPLVPVNVSYTNTPINKQKVISFNQNRANDLTSSFYFKQSKLDWSWNLMTLQNDQILINRIEWILIYFIIVMLAMAVLSELAAIQLSRYWTRQLTRLSQAVNYISRDQKNLIDELEMKNLPSELKVVYDTILETKSEIETTNQNLNLLVEEKTIELKKSNELLQSLANSDSLTGLYNRRFFNDELLKQWQSRRQKSQSLSLILMDIDHFKEINDQWGHPNGDIVLSELANHLLSYDNKGMYCISRIGGEEFAIISLEHTHANTMKQVESLIESIRMLEIPIETDDSEILISITVSLGVATIDASDESLETLYKQADKALYQAKSSGRNQIQDLDLSTAK